MALSVNGSCDAYPGGEQFELRRRRVQDENDGFDGDENVDAEHFAEDPSEASEILHRAVVTHRVQIERVQPESQTPLKVGRI